MATTTVFLTVEPQFHRYNPDRVAGCTVTNMTKNRPKRSTGVVVALELRIPDAAFLPLRPMVTVDVPQEALDYTPTVSVEFPEGDDAA